MHLASYSCFSCAFRAATRCLFWAKSSMSYLVMFSMQNQFKSNQFKSSQYVLYLSFCCCSLTQCGKLGTTLLALSHHCCMRRVHEAARNAWLQPPTEVRYYIKNTMYNCRQTSFLQIFKGITTGILNFRL